MYKIYLFLGLIISPLCAGAQLTNSVATPVATTIAQVTVFLEGAQIQRVGKATLDKGRNEFVFKALSPYLDKESIRLKGEGNFTVLSVNYGVNHLDEQQKRSEVELLKTKIDQLERVLQMATIEEEKIKLNLETIDAHEVVSAAVGSVDAVLKESDGTITCKLNATKKLLQGDHLHFTNIIYNLLDNAIKYSQDVPHITISTENYINDQILIKIKDNGIGISKDHLKKVFDKFYRVPTGNVHDVKGFGLGLNYVKIVVAAHHGTIKMDSDIGKGTTVSLLFNAFVPTEA